MWTKDQILEHLNYDAETGKFTFKDGVQAGALDLCEELHNAAIKQSAV